MEYAENGTLRFTNTLNGRLSHLEVNKHFGEDNYYRSQDTGSLVVSPPVLTHFHSV
jgi:hypothetical protein